MGNLNENSSAYYELNNFYETFSIAEDYPHFIDKKIIKYVKDKNVLDAGCGTGKFTNTIAKACKCYIGIDKSAKQISIANEKDLGQTFIVGDLSKLDVENNFFDITISSWCLGTIDLEKRKNVLSELKRVTKESIYLIENLESSEFEYIRGHDKDGTTKEYIEFLKNNGFKLIDEIDTYFDFISKDKAKEVFANIYNENVAGKVNNNIIKHKVGIFRMDLK